MPELDTLIDPLLEITRQAGQAIMEVYTSGAEVQIKSDGSPVTEADRKAERIITDGLAALTPKIPILSEEARHPSYAERRAWPQFWLVDPLDGTKEFIHRRGEFTVNIALVRAGVPVLGVVGVPARGLCYWGQLGDRRGAYRQYDQSGPECLRVSWFRTGTPTVVASRSHTGVETARFIERVKQICGNCELKSMGSSLKICLVAEGAADVYPRLGPTSEWDIAAAHAVLGAAGGVLSDTRGGPLRYNKENLLNPWFVAAGKSELDWIALTGDLQGSRECRRRRDDRR